VRIRITKKINSQKEGSKGRHNRNNNRGNSQNIDSIAENNENKKEQDKKDEEPSLDDSKTIKKVAINTPSQNLTEDASDNKDMPQESGLA
jgi:hypothetical protein